MSKQYSVITITKRTQFNFGIPKFTPTTDTARNLRELVNQLVKASRDGWLVYLSFKSGTTNPYGMQARFLQLLEDLTWTLQQFRLKDINGANSYLQYHEMKAWLYIYTLLLEEDYSYESLCCEPVLKVMISHLKDYAFLGKEHILKTRYFSPSLLKVLTEQITEYYKHNPYTDPDKQYLSDLNRLVKRFSELTSSK